MKIKMLDTVEDSHKFVEETDDNIELKYDVRIFKKEAVYDESNGGPDWERRARGLVKLGFAEEL